MSKRAPFSGKKPKKPEYEETPIVTIDNVPVDVPPSRETAPVKGGLVDEGKQLPEAHLGEQHDFAHLLAERHRQAELPVIHGKEVMEAPMPSLKVQPEPTVPELTGETEVEINRWRSIPLTTPIDTMVETKERATGYKLIPKEKKDGEHQET